MKFIGGLFVSLVFMSLSYAGAWGEGSFENDDALDWMADCIRSSTVAPVVATLNVAVRAKYLEAPEGSAAVAAAEVVAAALGRPSTKLPPALVAWIRHIPSAQLTGLAAIAKKAISQVRDPKISELRQLWSEDKSNKWHDVIVDLESRLEK